MGSPIVPIIKIEIDEDKIRQDIDNPCVEQLYKLIKNKKGIFDSLNEQMDDTDRDVFFNTLRNYYFPDGFFTTQRVADRGFNNTEIQEIANLLRPFDGKISRKNKAKGDKKRRYTKRRKSTKRRRRKKRRKGTKRR